MQKLMQRHYRHVYLYACIMSVVTQVSQLTSTPTHHDPWITIFVHGIVNVQPHLNLKTILRLMNDRVEGSNYQKRIAAIRSDPFFQRNQAIQGLGLVPVDKTNTASIKGAAASALATIFDQIYTWESHRSGDDNYYYTYGWSGLLSPSIRLKESHEFYRQLKEEITKYHAQGIYPKIRMVGYSHGGNIVLGLASAYKKDTHQTFSIDETILLGVPIQEETNHFVASQLFKRVINLYSRADRIQPLDYFSYKRFGSDRQFKPRHGLRLPKKLTQIEIRLFRNTKASTPKTLTCPDKRFDFDNPRILSGRTQGLRNTSPGHCELWSFGWTRTFYRKDFILSPLPVVALIPYLVESIKELAPDTSDSRHLIADIRLDQEMLIIREKHHDEPHLIPFMSRSQVEELKNIARNFAHTRPTKREYQRRLKLALARARTPQE